MKTMRKVLGKNLKATILVAAITAVALGGLLLLISGNEERNQVPIDPTAEKEETTEHAAESGQATQATQATGALQADLSQIAKKLFAVKVQSIEDSASVATLLETIDLKNNVANYRVEIQATEQPLSLNIRFDDKVVAEGDKDAFDKEMQKYAEQILALIADAQEVQWTYTLEKQGTKEETTVFLNEQQAQELLAQDVKAYGESAATIEALLQQQKGM